MPVTCRSTAGTVTTSASAIPPVGATLGHQREYLAVPGSESVDRTPSATPADQPGDDLRVEHGPARGHAPDRVDEARDIADTMLEQVADALGTIGEKLARVMILQELRQHEYGDVGLRGADLTRGAEPVVGAVGGHLDVGDDHVGLMRPGLTDQVGGVRGNGNDVETSLRQDVNHTLANKRLILPYDHSKGRVPGHRMLNHTPFARAARAAVLRRRRSGVGFPRAARGACSIHTARVSRHAARMQTTAPSLIPLGHGRSTGARATGLRLSPRRAPHGGWLLPAQERAVVMAAQQGGPREREQLIETFMPSIAGLARIYRRSSSLDWSELIQDGVVGMLRALERFDPELEVPFWGYASWWVRQAMQQLVSERSRPIVMSDRALRQLARVKDAQRGFEQRHHVAPSCGELAASVGLPRAQVESLLASERPSPWARRAGRWAGRRGCDGGRATRRSWGRGAL